MYCLRPLLVLLLFLKQEVDLTLTFRKFVYQKDMSEYCRRRVMPSVFLARQVLNAYSQVLHFSRLELPYSCFVSIRTESGNNIILVVQLASDKSVIESCRENKNLLLVYELGETFGGYWGALPENVMKPEPPTHENRYTLKTTQPTTLTTTHRRTTRRRTTPLTTKNLEAKSKPTSAQNEIVVEVPLVNVSAVLVPGDLAGFALFDAEESFDYAIDVKPAPGVSYKTKVLPLVQFAISDEVSGRRTGDGDKASSPQYEFDLNADFFTPDARLSYPIFRLSTRTRSKQRKFKYVNSIIDFKKNKKLIAEKEALFIRTSQAPPEQNSFKSQPSDSNKSPYFIQRSSQNASTRNPYEVVNDILKNLSKFKNEDPKTNMRIDKDVANLLQGLAKMGHSDSVFLVPNASWYTRRPASTTRLISTKYRTDSITWRQPPASYRTDYLEDVEDTSTEQEEDNKSSSTMQALKNNEPVMIDDWSSEPLLPLELDVDRVIFNVTQEKSIIVDQRTWSSEMSGTTTTATTPEMTFYVEGVEGTSKVQGMSEDANNSPSTIQAMSNNAADALTIDVGRSGPLLPLQLDVDRVILNVTQQTPNMEDSIIITPEMVASEVSGTTTTAATPETMKPMTLVDHESWDNMVQAASLMAVVLNQSITSSVDDVNHGLNVTLSPPIKPVARKKRFIHAISIKHARPHHLPLKVDVPSSTVNSDKISDAQEFQRLIELQDDEIHDRMALRYLRQYVGPVLFNICAFEVMEPTAKYTFMFNASRVVLAITNFTLDGMSVVLTPARMLLRADSRCAAAHLECQVQGARVCIDSLNACDGVANCGSHDVYDEDRLMCGVSAGLQHNVCLAAITFLAVLLTLIYTIHYWLKRCVPKVSDAFFIYTDAAENVLYLDPIMRSPHDTDDPKDIYRSTAMHEYMECTDMPIQKKTRSLLSRWARFFRCKRIKKLSHISSDQIIEEGYGQIVTGDRRLFSFAEVELGKMGSAFVNDVAVQTGSSLEFEFKGTPLIKERMTEDDSDSEDIVARYEGKRRSTDKRYVFDSEMVNKESSDELSILHFFKRARSVSMQVPSTKAVQNAEFQGTPITEEVEIHDLEYHSVISPDTVSVIAAAPTEISDIKPEPSLVRKRIRFEEELTTRQVSDDDEVGEEVATDPRQRRSVVYGGSKNVHIEDTDLTSHVDAPSASTGNREFKSYFWGGGKNKPKKPAAKKKNKQQLSLR